MFNITLPPLKKIGRYIVLCKRYKPSISSGDLKGKTKREVRLLLNIEIEKIRAEMNLMTDEVKELMRKKKAIPLRLAKPDLSTPLRDKRFHFQSRIFPPDEAYG